jgi:hypothetical protein
MKMNPPASSNSPTSRKKPRIIRHPLTANAQKRRQHASPMTFPRNVILLYLVIKA